MGGNCFPCSFSVQLLDPHGVHQKADRSLNPGSFVFWDCVDEGGDVVLDFRAVPDMLYYGDDCALGVGGYVANREHKVWAGRAEGEDSECDGGR